MKPHNAFSPADNDLQNHNCNIGLRAKKELRGGNM